MTKLIVEFILRKNVGEEKVREILGIAGIVSLGLGAGFILMLCDGPVILADNSFKKVMALVVGGMALGFISTLLLTNSDVSKLQGFLFGLAATIVLGYYFWLLVKSVPEPEEDLPAKAWSKIWGDERFFLVWSGLLCLISLADTVYLGFNR